MNNEKDILYICPNCKREVDHLHPVEPLPDTSLMRCDDCIDVSAAESQINKEKK